MAEKPPGGKEFDALMRKLAKVPLPEVRQQEAAYNRAKKARKRKRKK